MSRSTAITMVSEIVETSVCIAARSAEEANAVALEAAVKMWVSLVRLRARLRHERDDGARRDTLRLIRGGAAQPAETAISAARGLPPDQPAVRRSRAAGGTQLWVIRGGRDGGVRPPRAPDPDPTEPSAVLERRPWRWLAARE